MARTFRLTLWRLVFLMLLVSTSTMVLAEEETADLDESAENAAAEAAAAEAAAAEAAAAEAAARAEAERKAAEEEARRAAEAAAAEAKAKAEAEAKAAAEAAAKLEAEAKAEAERLAAEAAAAMEAAQKDADNAISALKSKIVGVKDIVVEKSKSLVDNFNGMSTPQKKKVAAAVGIGVFAGVGWFGVANQNGPVPTGKK